MEGPRYSTDRRDRKIYAAAATTIAADGETWVPIDFERQEGNRASLMVFPIRQLSRLEGTYPSVAHSLISDETAFLLVLNTEAHPAMVKKGEVIATYDVVDYHTPAATFSMQVLSPLQTELLGTTTPPPPPMYTPPVSPPHLHPSTEKKPSPSDERPSIDPFGLEEEFRENAPILQNDPSELRDDDLDWDVSPRLNRQQRRMILKMLRKHLKVFSGKSGRLGKLPAEFDLDLEVENDGKGIKAQQPYRTSPMKRRLIREAVNKLLELDIIEPSKSDVASPVVVVRQKGKARFCLDLREVNNHIKADRYMIPRQDNIFSALMGSLFFSTLDCNKGYHQLGVTPRSRRFLAFITEDGTFQYRRVPFGVKIAPAHFQRAIDKILAKYRCDFALAYIDDIVIYSRSFEQHVMHVSLVLQALEDVGMTLDHLKCHFGYDSIQLLGHRISRLGLSTLDDKVAAITSIPFPKTVKQAQEVLGLFNYYRSFIARFSWIAAPLYEGLKTSKREGQPDANLTAKQKAQARGRYSFPDTLATRQAFETLKKHLSSAPLLAFPDFSKEFILHTDACRHGIAGALHQVGQEDGKEHPVAYISRQLKEAESRYTATEIECLACVWCLSKFAHYLDGSTFQLHTDHVALKWIWTVKPESNARLFRWSLQLGPLKDKVKIIHRPGRFHANVDTLSRHPQSNRPSDDDVRVTQNSPLSDDDPRVIPNSSLPEIDISSPPPIRPSYSITLLKSSREWEDKLWEAYRTDRYCRTILLGLERKVVAREMEKKQERKRIAGMRTGEEPRKQLERAVESSGGRREPEESPETRAARLPGAQIGNGVHGEQVGFGLPEAQDGLLETKEKKEEGLLREERESWEELRKLSARKDDMLVTDGNFTLMGKLLFMEDEGGKRRLCIPEAMQEEILDINHELVGHQGIRRTFDSISTRYFFPRMAKKVRQHVNNCTICQASKPSKEKMGTLYPIPSTEPFHTISLDFVTGLPTSDDGYDAFLSITEKFTKSIFLIPCRTTTTAEETASLYLRYCYPHLGLPSKIISDRDPRFTSRFWTSLTSLLGISIGMTAAYHPSADGQAERSNQTVETGLRCFLGADETKYRQWPRYLPIFSFEYNAIPQESTGFSPNELRFAQPLRGIPDAPLLEFQMASDSAENLAQDLLNRRQEARSAIILAQRKQKKYFDKGRSDRTFNPGDLVLLRYKRFGAGYKPPPQHAHKLGPLATPLRVKERLSPVSYRLELPANSRIHDVVSIAHLKRFVGPHGDDIRPLPVLVDEEGEAEWEVEEIKGERVRQGRAEYLTKWKGYDDVESTWEPEENLCNSPDLLLAWRSSRPDPSATKTLTPRRSQRRRP
jgi:hypothetical protein